MKEKVIPIIAIIIGILAFVLTSQYLRRKNDEIEKRWAELYAGAERIPVVVAAHDIPGGSVIKREDLRRDEIFKSSAHDRVVAPGEANMIVGRKTVFEIKALKPVLWSDIVGGADDEKGLADTVKPGMRALSISVSGAASVSGMVTPNDRVDVLGTFSFPSERVAGEMETVTLTVLQDVTILAVGNQLSRRPTDRARRSGGYSTVTVEVTPREAELLVFAEQVKGRLVLSLRNSSDVSFESNLPSVDFEQLQTTLPEMNRFRQQNIRHKRNVQ
ncbi:MAG: Flp pilus assembly protein CpaB [Kiritimatiellae bacterium]|nr:Flp pilus assembly protein CpaB [Kiritimatiellia bacterium]